jgi:CHASE2 domain-containing sensor protein
MSATTIDHTGARDGLLRLVMRADAAISGLVGLAGIPLAGWLAEVSGTTKAFEYGMAVFLIAYGVVVFGLATLSSLRRAGMGVIIANVLYTVAAIVFVLADVFPLTPAGIVLNLVAGIGTLVLAELQYQGWRRTKA